VDDGHAGPENLFRRGTSSILPGIHRPGIVESLGGKRVEKRDIEALCLQFCRKGGPDEPASSQDKNLSVPLPCHDRSPFPSPGSGSLPASVPRTCS